MRWQSFIVQNVLVLFLLGAIVGLWMVSDHSEVCAAAEEAPKNTRPNPLTAGVKAVANKPSPWEGTFKGEKFAVTLNSEGKQFSGEIISQGTSMKLSATIEKNKMNGAFSFDKSRFLFTASLDGDTLTLTTDGTDFLLKRVVKSKQPKNPLTNPTPDPKNPTKPLPLPTPIKPGDTKGNLKTWARFPRGAFAQYTELIIRDQKLPLVRKERLIFLSEKNGDELLAKFEEVGSKWHRSEFEVPWQRGTKTIEKMGFVAAGNRQATMKVDDQALTCVVTNYNLKSGDARSPIKIQLEAWRSNAVNLPTQTLELPLGQMLVGSRTVRLVFKINFRGLLGTMDYKLKTLSGKATVSGKTVRVAELEGSYEFEQLVGVTKKKVTGQIFNRVSGSVPGGLIMFSHARKLGTSIQRVERKLESFGVVNQSQ
jgi:hypothetical protein